MTQLTLYNCTAERNRLNKGGYLEKVVDLQGVIKEDFSLTNPSIAVALDPNTVLMLVKSGNLVIDDDDDITTKDGLIKVTYSYRSKVLRANYAYIPELNRYYFINEISTQNGKLWTISMSVNVLMSYFAEIKELKAFVTRNEFTYQPELEDERISWKQSKFVDEYVPSSGALVNTNFKTAMNGVYLYYELATPVETDISEYIDSDVIEVSAGGYLEFENEDDMCVPYSATYQCEPETQGGE